MTLSQALMIDYTKRPLVFNVHKPLGRSSFFPVHIFKKNLSYDYGKIGHFGTLDPFAEGVLLVGVQGAQKMNDYVHRHMSKTYEATGLFGCRTTSGDTTTDIIEKKDIENEFQALSREELEDILNLEFQGEYWQSPHVISAAKFKGKRLYKLALEGRPVIKEKVKRDILNIRVKNYEYPQVHFEIEVSSGTYIRSFFEDVSALFGGVGMLTRLTRTRIGQHSLLDSLKEEAWPVHNQEFNLMKYGMTIDHLYPLHQFHLEEFSAKKYLAGQRCPLLKAKQVESVKACSDSIFWIYTGEDLLGMGEIKNEMLTPVFNLPIAIKQYLPS